MRTTTLATYTRFAALLTAVAAACMGTAYAGDWEHDQNWPKWPSCMISTQPFTRPSACTILSMAIHRPRSQSEFGRHFQSGRKMRCSR